MTAPLPPRESGNPLVPIRAPLAPQPARSRAGTGLAAMAARGRFALQVCTGCAAVQYPPRDLCHRCLGHDLSWQDVPDGATVLAATITRISGDPYFRHHTPWRSGLVQLDAGPTAVAHLHGEVATGARARMRLHLDTSGQGVMLALPILDTPNMDADPQLREFTADPRGRRVLVTDGRSAFGRAIAQSMLDAGAATVFSGIADAWKPFTPPPGDTIDLDLTDTTSVHRLTAEFGGRIDIVIDTTLHIRPGGMLDRGDIIDARDEMERVYFGPLRLAQSLGPALRGRAGDGTHAACAWVSLISIAGLVPQDGYRLNAAAHAACLSLTHTLRAELRPLKILAALVGPLDDDWHQHVPPPKVTPAHLAAAVLRGLKSGLEDITVGDIAQDVMDRWTDHPAITLRQS